MTTGNTTLLGLALPVEGELDGTWGDVVNQSITELVDSAVAGTTTLSADSDATLTDTALAANQARQAIILWTASNGATTRNITAPARSKAYAVINAGTGSIVLRGAGPTTGITIISGEKCLAAWNGSDFVKIATSTAAPGDVVGPASATSNGIALFDGTTGKLLKNSASQDGLIYGITVGRGAGAVATNTAVGASALNANTTGLNNTAVGYQTAYSATTGSYLTAFGYQAGYSYATTTSAGTFVGWQAGYTTTGDNNVAMGARALYANSTGSYNTALGDTSLRFNTTANYNTAVGYQAGYANTTGSNNTAVGKDALQANTTASNNTAVGYQAGYSNQTGLRNTFIGATAGYTCTTPDGDTHVGYGAGYSQTTGLGNTFVGGRAGGAGANLGAGFNVTTGTYNTFVGGSAGANITTGGKNSILGNYNGNQSGLDIRTASNYIVLSDGDGNPRMYNNGTDWYDAAGKLRAIPQSGSAKTGSYTLATTDVGEFIEVGSGGSITVPNATFSTGDAVAIFNNTSGSITLTMSIATAYIGGTDSDKATISLATRGVCNVLFISGTVCVVTGNVT